MGIYIRRLQYQHRIPSPRSRLLPDIRILSMAAPTVFESAIAPESKGADASSIVPASSPAKNGLSTETNEEDEKAKVLKQGMSFSCSHPFFLIFSQTILKRIVEFYFADSNLPFDKFLWTLHSASPEHWVPLATIASFKRMRQFQVKGVPWIADVLRQGSSLLEIDPSGTKIRRPDEIKEPEGILERSVYAVSVINGILIYKNNEPY